MKYSAEKYQKYKYHQRAAGRARARLVAEFNDRYKEIYAEELEIAKAAHKKGELDLK